MKIKVTEWDNVSLNCETRQKNEDRSQEKGFEIGYSICACCGNPIKKPENAKSLHLIEGGVYFTEYEGEINTCKGADMGWWIVEPVCYKKYKKNEKEVEIINED